MTRTEQVISGIKRSKQFVDGVKQVNGYVNNKHINKVLNHYYFKKFNDGLEISNKIIDAYQTHKTSGLFNGTKESGKILNDYGENYAQQRRNQILKPKRQI